MDSLKKEKTRENNIFLIDLPEKIHVHPTETIFIKCTLKGSSWKYPSPLWLKDEKPIVVRSSRIILSYDGKTASLRVLSCNESDEGTYTLRFDDYQETSCRVVVDEAEQVATCNMSDEIDIATCEDEDKLMAVMNKTEDLKKRKEIRLRLKEIRDKEMKRIEERKKERDAAGSLDSVKMRAEMANKGKERQLKSYQNMAAKSNMGHSYDPVKECNERKQQDKANQLKMMEELAKTGGGPGEYQSGCERIKQIEMEFNDRNAARMYQQFDDLHVNDYLQREKAAHIMANANNKSEGQKSQPHSTSSSSRIIASDESRIKQNLLDWVKLQVRDYKEVKVTNFSTSWGNGLAFCALIHHFYPESFDFSNLKAENRRDNFQLAFDTAEKYGGVTPLLEVEDMMRMRIPDYQCVFTYVQSIYGKLRMSDRCNR